MSYKLHVRGLNWLVICALLLSALLPAFGMAVPQAALAQEAATPPILLSTAPTSGAAWDGGPVTFTFDRPMASTVVLVNPSLDGSTSVDGTGVVFTPAAAPEAGVRYRFTLARGEAEDGMALASSAAIVLQATGPLAVAATQPSNGAEDTDPTKPVVVIFNRPVVPLTGVEEQAGLPQPLTFEPAVAGQGAWISTSVYQFVPDAPLGGGTTYEVTVDALTDVSGESMGAPYLFQFRTSAPIVLGSTPQGIFIAPDTAVTVNFSQPMDPDSTTAAFSVTRMGDRPETVIGITRWDITNTTLVFTPITPLAFGADYLVQVADMAQPASRQGNIRQPYESTFTVAPLPAVASTSILDGAEGVNPENELRVRFTTPVSDTTVLEGIRISPPPISGTNVVSYTYSDYYENTNQNQTQIGSAIPFGYNTHLTLNWYKEPNTAYTVTFGSDIADAYGNTLGEEYSLSFATGNYAPMIQLDLARFTHYSAFTTTVVGVKYRNIDSIDAELFRLPLDDLYRLGGENSWQIWDQYQAPDREQNLVWTKTLPGDGPPNVVSMVGFTLNDAEGNPLPPGAYLLQVRDPVAAAAQGEGQSQAPPYQKAVIILSNNNITLKRGNQGESLAWLTSLADGQPIAGLPVVFTKNGAEIAQGTTDADGIAMAALGLAQNEQYTPIFATSGQPGEPDFAVVSSEWNEGIQPWSFNIYTGGMPDQALINLYTERPIYRPGQTVYWKGIVRLLEEDVWTVPAEGQTLNVRINDTLGNLVLDRAYTVNQFGTIDGEFVLAADAPTGYYSINTELKMGEETNGAAPTIAYGSASFVVAAYRKPEFQIEVKTDQPEYIQGDTIKVDVQANYFSGGPLADAPVEWRLIANTSVFAWPDAPEGRYYSFEPFDPDVADYNPYASAYLGLVREGKGQTDADGSFTLELPADLGSALASQQWSLDVVITSPTSQQVFNQVQFPVHRGAYYIGLSPQSYVAEAGSESAVDVATVTPDGERYPNADLDVVVYEFQWNSVYEQAEDGNFYWKSTAKRTPVFTTTVSSDAQGEGVVTFTPAKGGQYQVAASGEDEAGNRILSAVFIWAADAGSGYVAWPRENNDRIELVADRKRYAPGDTARVLIPNPFSGPVQALVTLERGGVMEARLVELTGSSQTIEVPITAEQIPNVFVGVVIVKELDETNPFPATRVGYTRLSVDTSEKAITVDVATSAATVEPGDTVTYTLTLRDSAGNPVPNAETSVAVVDKAVLVLGAAYQNTQPMIDIFYYERPLGVTTGSLIVINKDRVSAQLAEGGKGGGGGGGDGGPEVREDFPDTAYWRADLVSDADGVIEFAVPLPDNLTTWVMTARSITKDTLVGEATNEVVATKELQVRPALPRFFTAGDRAVIAGVVINRSDTDLEGGTFDIAVSGATLDSDANAQSFSLAAGEFTTFDIPITVDMAASTVVVTMTASTGDGADGVRIARPVLQYQTPETVGASGVVPVDGVTEAVYVPESATDDGELLITLDPSLAAGLVGGLTYLKHFPHECNEQTVSRFLPNIFTVSALRKLAIENQELETQLSYQLGIGVQQLLSRQNPDGGWGYWPQEQSAPFITAYVLWGLWNADQMGHNVDSGVFERGATYLDSQFQAPGEVTQNWQLNEMAFTHYVLAQMGRGDTGRMSTLYDVRERLDSYGKAFLAMALHTVAPAGAQVTTLMDDLLGSAILTASGASWQDAAVDYQTMGSDVRSTAIVLDTLVQIQPDQPILPSVVRWLMEARTANHWPTTQENAWSIIALTDWMVHTGELEASYDWSVALNDGELGSGSFADPTDQVQLREETANLLRDEANLLRYGRSDGPGQMYYTTYLTYNLDALAVAPLNRGMVVERQFVKEGVPVSTVQVGDIVSATVTIVAPTDLFHVLVEAPIPAGFELLDPNLPTGFQYDQQGQPVLKPLNAAESGWYNWMPASLDYRDDKVAMFATYLPAGAYQYTFEARAAYPGEYRVLPAHGEMMYFPEVWGRSAGQGMTVTR